MNDLIEIPCNDYNQIVFELADKSTNEVNEYLGIKFIQTILKTGESLSELDKIFYLFEIVDEKKFFLHKIYYGL